MHRSESITDLIDKLRCAAAAADFTVESFGQVELWPLLGMTRKAESPTGDSQHIYLSAGIHGDEPAGPQALLELLESDALPHSHHYYLCPLLNPAGLAIGTRENARGIDLNRDYRDFAAYETQAHRQWIADRITQLDHAIHLHEDWESQGFYLYELNFTDRPSRTQQILAATVGHLPTESATVIDGSPALGGIIRPEALPEIEEGHPEAIFLHREYGGTNHTLESPSARDFHKRVEALKAAVDVLLQEEPHPATRAPSN